MLMNLRWAASIMVLTALGGPASADVITDWNEKAVAFVTKQRLLPPQAERVIASVHLAMFDAVNSIEPPLSAVPACCHHDQGRLT